MRQELRGALDQTIADFGEEKVAGVLTRLGQGAATDGPGGGAGGVGSHILSFTVELVSTSQREFTTADFSTAWQARVPPLPGVDALTFNSSAR